MLNFEGGSSFFPKEVVSFSIQAFLKKRRPSSFRINPHLKQNFAFQKQQGSRCETKKALSLEIFLLVKVVKQAYKVLFL